MRQRWRSPVAFLSGLSFALGLGVSGMGRPAKILAFLDIGGAWDPSLLLVMAGAIAVHAPFALRAAKRRVPLLGGRFVLPAGSAIDRSLVVGAALFGIGWGLQGYCPGPAVAASATGAFTPVLFVLSMIAGFVAFRLFEHRDRPEQGGAPDNETEGEPARSGSITPI